MTTRQIRHAVCITLCLIVGYLPSQSLRAESNLDAEYASQTGTAITIIFDNSGSMQGSKMTEAKQAFKWWLEKAAQPDAKEASTAWSLVTFDNGGQIEVPFSPDAASSRRIAIAVDRLDARTNTPIVASLNVAMKQINTRRAKVSPYQRHVVLLFTDGQENADKGGTEAVIRTILAMRAASVEVVGIGYYGDGDYLDRAVTRYYSASSERALRAGLAKVDAEVDLGGEVFVTQADLHAMQTLPGPAANSTLQEGSIIVPHIPRPGSTPSSNIIPRQRSMKDNMALAFLFTFGLMLFMIVAAVVTFFQSHKSKH
ncbi:MAG: VWA domain-containing protein [Candidatus Methylacidiphilales bacterium]|nr:vWA domain-containing protein [Candidatus Methylacidiphilales bacterium]